MSRNPDNWVVQVRCAGREPFWMGTYQAEGRQAAKRAARQFVSAHLPLDTTILAIARGRMDVQFDEAPIPYEAIE
jgi:hypothetical protein